MIVGNACNAAIKTELRCLSKELPWSQHLQAATILRQMGSWHNHALSRQFPAYPSGNKVGNLEPRAERSLTILSTAKSKDVNAIQWRAWSLPKEEKKTLPTMCWLAWGESECNFPCYFTISHFCAKSAISSSCLQSCLSALRVAIRSYKTLQHLGFSVNCLWRFVWGHGLCQEHCTRSPRQEQNYKPIWFPQSLPIVCVWGG